MAARPAVAPTWGGTQTEPSGGLKASGYAAGDRPAAQHLNWLYDNWSDWINYLDTDYLTAVPRLAADVPVIASAQNAHDHPGSASNKWKLQHQGEIHTGTHVRLYSGDESGSGGGMWILTWNALWNADSGDQFWSKDDDGKIATALFSEAGGLSWLQRTAAGTWTTGWTAGAGDIFAGGDVNVGDDLVVAGDAGVTGTVTATAGVNIGAGGEVVYAPVKLRTSTIPLWSGQNGTFSGGTFSDMLSNGGSNVRWPLKFPVGATLGTLEVICNQATTTPATISVYKRSTTDWAAVPGAPSDSTADSESTPASTGRHRLQLDLTSETVADGDDYVIEWDPGDNGDDVLAIRMVDWQDVGAARY